MSIIMVCYQQFNEDTQDGEENEIVEIEMILSGSPRQLVKIMMVMTMNSCVGSAADDGH